jgi:hypothetical protein
VLFAIALLAAAVSAPQPQVLFVVINRGSELAIEPAAMVTKTPGPCAGCWQLHFDDVLGDHVTTHPAFSARYYRHGRTYRVLTGGFEVGTATVEEETSLGCVSLAATVKITPPLPEYWPALAVGSLHVPPRTPDRLETTPEEEKALGVLARRAFRNKGVRAAFLPKMRGTDFLTIDLNHDGQRDLIGTFEIGSFTDADKALPAHEVDRLFLIAIADDAGNYHADYVWYAHWADGMSENQVEETRLVDTLDLDEDGVDEVITSSTLYEGNQYQILKRGHNGKWTIVYRGGGSGC